MWKERYKIGAPLVDQQHKELFKRVSAFIQVVQSDVPWELKIEKVKETLSFMQRYVIEHFEAEEKFQEEIGYPGLEEHRKIHEQFKGAIQQYVDRFEKEGFTKKLVQEFAGKLMTWLILHVAGDDQKIGEYYKSIGGEKK